jgi:hypothetical protein
MRIRIENIECRNSHGRYEIVKWYPNSYYGREEGMIEEGYTRITMKDGNWAMTKDWHTVHGSCFVNEESCYTIATLEWDADEWCNELVSVGARLLDLSKEDRDAFFEVYRYAEDRIKQENLEEDED